MGEYGLATDISRWCGSGVVEAWIQWGDVLGRAGLRHRIQRALMQCRIRGLQPLRWKGRQAPGSREQGRACRRIKAGPPRVWLGFN